MMMNTKQYRLATASHIPDQPLNGQTAILIYLVKTIGPVIVNKLLMNLA